MQLNWPLFCSVRSLSKRIGALRFSSVYGGIAAIILIASSGSAIAQTVQPSAGALNALRALQAAVNTNDYSSVPALVAAANAVATTNEDKYLVGQLQLKAAVAAHDSAAEISAIDEIANSSYLPASKNSDLYLSLGASLYNSKQFAQAQTAFQKAAALNPTSAEARALLGEALFAQGDKANAAAAFELATEISSAAGQKPDEKLMKRAVGLVYLMGSPHAVELARQWLTAYPSFESWRDSIAIYRNFNHPDVEGTLDLLRLMQATGSLALQQDYVLFAQAAAEQNNFNEARAVLDAGISANVVDPTDSVVRDLSAGLRAKPMVSPADLDLATRRAANGITLLRIGDRYFSMGNYTKAVEVYDKAALRSDVEGSLANLHIGMALARAGEQTKAIDVLNRVTGPLAPIAEYWIAFAKSGPPPPVLTPAPRSGPQTSTRPSNSVPSDGCDLFPALCQ